MTSSGSRKADGDAARVERELLARLGLNAKASDDQVEAAHVELVKFLESAPAELRPWAQTQIASVDEAYALLSNPTTAPRERTVRRRPRLTRGAIAAVAAAVIAVVIFVVYRSGNEESPSAASSSTATETSSQIDQAEIAPLMEKLAANPNDVDALVQLGDIYFQAGDYNVAGNWMQKAVAIEPKNVTARLALGAAQYNLGNSVAAEEQWREVIAIEPENVEAYYDLGFLYLSKDPPDEAAAKEAWGKVIEIAPDSEVAKTVTAHLGNLDGSTTPSSTAPAATEPASTAPASTTAPPTTTGP